MKINQIKAGIFLSYASLIIGCIISILYTPAMLRLLGQDEYGVYSLASSTASYLGLLSLGFSSAYMRYFMRYSVNEDTDGEARLNGMFLIIFTVLGVVALICGSLLCANADRFFAKTLTADQIKRTQIIMGILTLHMAISLPMSLFSSYITALERYVFLKAAGILRSIISPLITLPLLIMGGGSIAIALVTATLSVAADLLYAFYCLKKLGMRFDFSKFDFSLLREIAVFSSFIFVNMITDQINWSADKFILGVVKGAAATAVYSVAAQLNSYYLQFSQAMSSVFIPRVNRIAAEKDDPAALTELFIRVGRAQFMLLALFLTGFILFGRLFIELWAGYEYIDAYIVALFVFIPVTVPSIQNIGVNIQQAQNKHKFRSIAYLVIAVINIFFTIPLSYNFGAIGAAAGTSFSLIAGHGIAMNVYYHKKIGLDIPRFWCTILQLLPSMIPPIAFGVMLNMLIRPCDWSSFGLCCVSYAIVYCASVFVFGMKREERTMFGPLSAALIRLKQKILKR